MWIKGKRGWEIPESQVTPESVFRQRRRILKAAGIGTILAGSRFIGGGLSSSVQAATGAPEDDPSAGLYPLERNERYQVDRAITEKDLVTTYNNYYEFGSSKTIWQRAQNLPIRPWTVSIGGMVEEPMEIGVDDLLARMPLEERVYRLRCVEAWSMVLPLSGFPLAALVKMARPSSSARYVKMQTFMDPQVAPGQRGTWYPWPYTEGLTMEEATNELAFIATGLYGKPIPKQNGSPLRLSVPWKYGFKWVKGIVSFEFTEERPKTFWETIASIEYGFWANVNPEVPHPRWSQARERVIGANEEIPTQRFNGYEEFVANLYTGLEGEGDRLYR